MTSPTSSKAILELSENLSLWALHHSPISDWPADVRAYWGQIYIIVVKAFREWNKEYPLNYWIVWKTMREWWKYKRDYCRNELLNRKNERVELVYDSGIVNNVVSGSDPEWSIWVRIDLKRFIASQSPKRKRYLELLLEGWDNAEIAEIMEVTGHAINNYMNIIRQNMRKE